MDADRGLKIFISWSGDRSGAVAEALRTWLTDVIQVLDPWVSKQDIHAGARWSSEIQKELRLARFGILVLTPENVGEAWLLFEAGAIANQVNDALVCPYLVGGLRTADVPEGPLSQFQAKEGNKTDTWGLLLAINGCLEARVQNEANLKRRFDLNWPRLEETLKALPKTAGAQPTRRSQEDMLEEMLVRVRRLEQGADASASNQSRVEFLREMTSRELLDNEILWKRTIAQLNKRKRILGAFLVECEFVGVHDDDVVVRADELHRAVIESQEHKLMIAAELLSVFGRPLTLRVLPN